MTRNDARLIAEELIPLMRKEVKRIVESVLEKEAQKEDEFVGFDEASKITKLSIRYLREHIKEIPHAHKGRKRVFSKAGLIAYMNG